MTNNIKALAKAGFDYRFWPSEETWDQLTECAESLSPLERELILPHPPKENE